MAIQTVLNKGDESLTFKNIKSAAVFLSEHCEYKPSTIAARLYKRIPSLAGYDIAYHMPETNTPSKKSRSVSSMLKPLYRSSIPVIKPRYNPFEHVYTPFVIKYTDGGQVNTEYIKANGALSSERLAQFFKNATSSERSSVTFIRVLNTDNNKYYFILVPKKIKA